MGQKPMPGYVAPFLGAILGAYFAAKQVIRQGGAATTQYALIGAALGFLGGLVIWALETFGGKKRK